MNNASRREDFFAEQVHFVYEPRKTFSDYRRWWQCAIVARGLRPANSCAVTISTRFIKRELVGAKTGSGCCCCDVYFDGSGSSV